MEIPRARENAAILFQYLQKPDDILTSSILREDKLKIMGPLGRVWEAIVDRLWNGSASRARIEKVSTLMVETLNTLDRNRVNTFDVPTGFMRSNKYTLPDLADRIKRSPQFIGTNVFTVADNILRKHPLKV